MFIQKYHADEMFHSGKTWEVQPVTMEDGEKRVHLWPMADETPDETELLPDDAERLGKALIASAEFARR
jgi:hypothetical protein